MKYDDFIDKNNFNKKVIAPSLNKYGYSDMATNILNCSNRRYYAKCKKCGAYHFNGVMSCKQRLCAVCQKKRSLLWYMKMLPIFKYYLNSGNKIVFVTFTIKNTEKLKDGLDYLQNGFRLLSDKAYKITKAFKYLFIGGVRSIEIKRGANSNLWHPHMHCIFIKRNNTQFKEDLEFLKSAWNTVLCTVHGKVAKWGSVDYKAINKTSNDKFKLVKLKSVEDCCKAICETFKYATKFDWQNQSQDIPELVEAIKGRRLIVPCGSIRNLLSENDIEHDLILPYTEIKKRFCAVCGENDFEEFYTYEFSTIRDSNIYDFRENEE